VFDTPIRHAATKVPGERGYASEWNADHIITEEDKAKRSVTIIIAASNSKDKTKADYVCDGVADEVEIQTAINLLISGGRIILLEGTYNIATNITMGNDIILEGQGWNTILSFTGAGTGSDYYYFIMKNKSRIVIRDLKFSFGHAGESKEGHIDIAGATDITFENILFEKNLGSVQAILRESSDEKSIRITIKNCRYTTINGGEISEGFWCELTEYAKIINNNGTNETPLFSYIAGETIKYSLIHGNRNIGDIVLQTGCIRNTITSNYLTTGTIRLDAGANYNTVVANVVDTAVINNGTGNEVAHNAIF